MKTKLGALLRAIRNSKHLTIKEVVAKAGVSSSLLSQIERNRISPSLDTLLQLLEVYGVSPTKFFKDYETHSRVEIIKKGERKIYQRKGFKYEKLCGESQEKGNHSFSAFFLELGPGQKRGSSRGGHLGRELGIVVAGSAQLIYGGEIYEVILPSYRGNASPRWQGQDTCGNNCWRVWWVITVSGILLRSTGPLFFLFLDGSVPALLPQSKPNSLR